VSFFIKFSPFFYIGVFTFLLLECLNFFLLKCLSCFLLERLCAHENKSVIIKKKREFFVGVIIIFQKTALVVISTPENQSKVFFLCLRVYSLLECLFFFYTGVCVFYWSVRAHTNENVKTQRNENSSFFFGGQKKHE